MVKAKEKDKERVKRSDNEEDYDPVEFLDEDLEADKIDQDEWGFLRGYYG